MNPKIQQLITLQEADMALSKVEHALSIAPEKINFIEKQIKEFNNHLLELKKHLQSLEVQRKALDTEVHQLEDKIVKYKTQQLSVRKNEEYAAMTAQIEFNQLKLNQLEEQELALLFEIDSVKSSLLEKEAATNIAVTHLLDEKTNILKNIQEMSEQKISLSSHLSSCLNILENDLKDLYKSVKSSVRRFPYITNIKDHYCQGCFLKVSKDVESATKMAELNVRCGNCGRILFI